MAITREDKKEFTQIIQDEFGKTYQEAEAIATRLLQIAKHIHKLGNLRMNVRSLTEAEENKLEELDNEAEKIVKE